jgi:hypothetical protein
MKYGHVLSIFIIIVILNKLLMNEFWINLTEFLSFTGIKDHSVWQDIIVSSFLIPIFLLIIIKLKRLFDESRPLKLLLKGVGKHDLSIFLSQINPINEDGGENHLQKYVIKYLEPTPRDSQNISKVYRKNINPVWPEAEGLSLAYTYNLLGRLGKEDRIFVRSLINDWHKLRFPTISIGFNPKTEQLLDACSPVMFTYDNMINGGELKLKNGKERLDAYLPNDAGVIQKTFIKNSKIPIFILAGLGTYGTMSAAYLFAKHAVDLGKLYGDRAFCVLLSVNVNQGNESAFIKEITPRIPLINKILHFSTYLRYRSKISDNTDEAKG